MKQFTCLGQNRYQHANGGYYGCFNLGGVRIKRKLASIAVREARQEIAKLAGDHARAGAAFA